MDIQKMIVGALQKGYSQEDAEAKVCQDIVLKAIAESGLSKKVTIKGGVVMRSLTGNVRRATQDMDIDFIKYPLTDDAIDDFINKIDCISDISIKRIGKISELNQQDYKGKSIRVEISDSNGNILESKIDLGVHKRFEIEQEEYCFDIEYDEEGASLLINSKEQMFSEKLRSLLKFGPFSTRYKDIYDLYYYKDCMDIDKLGNCLDTYILSDDGMRENSIGDIVRRIGQVFQNKQYKARVDQSDKRWLDEPIDSVFAGILEFLIGLM